MKPKRKTPNKPAGKNSRVETVKVREDVMEVAKKLAAGNHELLLCVSKDDVIVMNYPGQYKRSDFR